MKKFLGLVLTLVILVLLLGWCVSSEDSLNGVKYDVSDDKTYAIVVGCDDELQDITIEKEYKGLPVTKIAEESFYNCDNLTSVVIPDSVTSIGSRAFSGCSALTSIVIPDSVTSIGDSAFSGCVSLNFNTYDNCQYLGNEGNPYLALFDVRNNYNYNSRYEIHPDTKVIAGDAFSGSYFLKSIVIPDNVTSIGSWAFSGCSALTSIVIPDSVTSIGERAFVGCDSLTDVYYAGTEAEWAKINIGSGNAYLTSATIHYEYVPEE